MAAISQSWENLNVNIARALLKIPAHCEPAWILVQPGYITALVLSIQLDLQTILHKFDNGLFEQILDVIHATDVCHLQQLADLLSPSIFFRGAILSGYIVNLLCGASILHHAGGLHIVWDCLRVPDPPLSVRTTKGRIRYSRCAHIPHTSDRELGERESLKHCKFPTQNMGSELISWWNGLPYQFVRSVAASYIIFLEIAERGLCQKFSYSTLSTVPITAFLNSAVYLLFGLPFGVIIPLRVIQYTILSNKWGAVHPVLCFYFYHMIVKYWFAHFQI